MTDAAPLPRSTPTARGVDPGGLLALLDGLERADIEMHSLMVLRHGHVVAEGWWRPYDPTEIALVYSLSKSVTSTAAGLAVHEGLLDTDDRVLDHFPEVTAAVHPRLAGLRVHHLLSMSTGHLADTLPEILAAHLAAPDSRDFSSVDLAPGFFSRPPEQDPGTVFAYHNTGTYLLARIVQRVTDQSLVDYLTPRLFAPLGITDAYWADDGRGNNLGFSGLHLRTDSVARLGQLYLQRGRWRDAQLVPVEWVDRATRLQTPTDGGDRTGDWARGYGYQFWMSRHGYRGDGAFGQFCLVLPEQDLVVAITSSTERMQDVLDQVWQHLLPACDASAPGDPDELERRLTDRLAALELSGPELLAGAAVAGGHSSTCERPVRWEPAASEPTPAPVADLQLISSTPILDGLELHGPADDPVLAVLLDGVAHELPLHPDAWRRGSLSFPGGDLAVATRGGLVGEGELRAEMVLLNKPHRLLLHGRDGRLRTEYAIPPLGSPRLADLALPHTT